GEEPLDDLGRAEGPGSVVNQHRVSGDRRKARTYGIGALGATADEPADIQSLEGRRRLLLLSFADDDPGRAYRRVAEQRLDRPAQHRLAAQQSILLGHGTAEALALPGRVTRGGDCHARGRLGRLGLSAEGGSPTSAAAC